MTSNAQAKNKMARKLINNENTESTWISIRRPLIRTPPPSANIPIAGGPINKPRLHWLHIGPIKDYTNSTERYIGADFKHRISYIKHRTAPPINGITSHPQTATHTALVQIALEALNIAN
jgi:hypothetical protein